MADVATEQPQPQKYEFNVSMSCGGCSRAVDKVLSKLQKDSQSSPEQTPEQTAEQTSGIPKYEVSLEKQTATVFAYPDVPYETILKKIAATGKKVNSAKAGDKEMSVDISPAA